jgi:4a-hydroxytetrahydrobiopterin dehydratase
MKKTEQDKFTIKAIQETLRAFPGWSYNAKEKIIEKTFDRKNFLGCAAFIQQIANVAEKQDHHPDILLSGYKNVKVMLSTHSAGGITQNDFDLAKAIDKLAK